MQGGEGYDDDERRFVMSRPVRRHKKWFHKKINQLQSKTPHSRIHPAHFLVREQLFLRSIYAAAANRCHIHTDNRILLFTVLLSASLFVWFKIDT